MSTKEIPETAALEGQQTSAAPVAPVSGSQSEKKMLSVTFKSGFVDLRKGKGWAAVLLVNEKGEIQRDFININKIWGKGGFVFDFEGQFREGTVIEVSEGGSWKNTYRWYYVVQEGENQADRRTNLRYIGPTDSIKATQEMMQILGVKQLRWAWRGGQ